MSDSIVGGMAVDIRTGKPRDRGPTEKQMLLEGQLESDVAAGIDAERDLNSESGQAFVEMLENELARRISELVAADPEGALILRLLGEKGDRVVLAQAAAKRLTRIRLGRQAKEIPNIE